MPITVSIGGKLEPFFDERRQIAVESKVFGTCVVEAPPGSDPSAAEGYVNRCIVYGVDQVLHRMIQERHISVVQAPNAIPHHLADFVASSGLQQNGFQIHSLELTLKLEMPPEAGAFPPPQAAPPAQQGGFDMPQVNYRLNIGGLKIKGSTGGGIDGEHLAGQIANKAVNQVVGGIVVAVVGVLLIGGIVAYAVLFKGKGGGAEASWDGKTPFSCTGNDSVRLKGVTATLTTGTAISANGNCKLTLDDVKVSAPIGLEAAGNATVTFNGGSVDAKEAVKALGNANVTLKGTQVKGTTTKLGNAKIVGP